MATPNYGYEKRQRELAKKKKKEDKLRSKTADRRPDNGSGYAQQPDAQAPDHNDGGTGTDADSAPSSPQIQPR